MIKTKNSKIFRHKLIVSSAVFALFSFGSSQGFAQQLPPADAKPGECYAKVLLPAVYQTAPATFVSQPSSSEIKEIPAEYKDVEKRVLIEEESFELEVVPATYELQKIRVLVTPERKIKRATPAQFKTVSEKVLISPARTEWKKGRGAHEKIDEATGEIMCLVEIPAEYQTVEKTVMITPAAVSEDVIPAEYKLMEKRVMKTPPTTRKKVIPAKYENITVRELVRPASYQEVKIPAITKTVQKRQLVSKERVEWREILCETNTTPEIILDLQQRLVNAGYGLGGSQPNGNYGPATQAAVRQYQLDNGLPTGGLTISTLKRLGMRADS